MAKGAGEGWLFEGGDNFKYFHQREATIRGRRLIEGRLLFEEIRYLTCASSTGPSSLALVFDTCTSPITHFICRPPPPPPTKIGITFVFHFSWALQPSLAISQRKRSDDRKCVCFSQAKLSRKKLKTILKHNLGGGVAVGGQIGCIMGEVQVVDAKKAWDRVAGLWKSSPLKTLVAWISSYRFESFFCCYWGSNNNSK